MSWRCPRFAATRGVVGRQQHAEAQQVAQSSGDEELRGEADGRSRLAARVQRAQHGREALVLLGHAREQQQVNLFVRER